jgi:hypothetical protein
MILIDYSGIAIASLFSQGMNGQPISEGLVRHMILNSLRAYNVKYRNDYGEMIICCDGGNLWRKQVYAHYKANRAKNREESSVDWTEFFRILNLVREELRQFMPYKVLHIPGAEADDIIAVMTQSTQEFGHGENVMIISADHDFVQLQKYSNVKQFSPMTKKLIVEKNPVRYLQEKILRGDSGDGVPNILSDDRVFVDSGRQKPMMAKKIDLYIQDWEQTLQLPNVQRNRVMIDFDAIPTNISDSITKEAINTIPAPNSGVLNYLIEKRCSQLTGSAAEFFVNK